MRRGGGQVLSVAEPGAGAAAGVGGPEASAMLTIEGLAASCCPEPIGWKGA